jgi:predicted ATP-grasp superfamily ATP-dependent carboligase/CelD/BcsL family acetyltransferase involved in cellulose biosynthesis
MSGDQVRVREALPVELLQWDRLIERFPHHRATHTRAWVESLGDSGLGRPLYLLFERAGEVVGCLPGLLTSAGPWSVFGSPRAGWQTSSMGPVFDPAHVRVTALLDALVPYLEDQHRVAHIELTHPALTANAMEAAGFRSEPVPTTRARLHPGDRDRTVRGLHESARRNVQRARRLGLEVRFEDDDAFIREHYDQLREVFTRGGHAITFGEERVRACVERLRAAGTLLAASVYLPGGRVNIATATFVVHGRELLLWMWAHRTHYRWYRPTELLTWSIVERAVEAGCDTLDLAGRGDFKTKFGAEPDLTQRRWMRSRPAWLGAARHIATTGYRVQQSLRGRTIRAAAAARSAMHGHGDDAKRPLPPVVLGDCDLVRALGLAGVRSVVVAPPGDGAHFSRHTCGALPWTDAWEHPGQLVERLVAYGQAQREPPALFYEDDRSLLLVSRHREALRGAFRFVVPDAELVEDLVDKGRFRALAARRDLPVPPAAIWDPRTAPDDAVRGLSWPVVAKPLMRRVSSWAPLAGDAKALRCDSLEDLLALGPQLAAARLSVLVQSLVPGPESRIESYHTYVGERGAVVAEFTGRKVRTHPAHLGDSTALELTDAPDVVRLGRDIVKRIGLKGVAKLDFKRDPDGRLHLLEINPRFTLWHHLGARGGLNIPALVYADLMNRPRPTVAPVRAGARWCRPWADRHAARESGIPMRRWIPWALRSDALRCFAWDDPAPLLRAAFWRWSHGRATAAMPATHVVSAAPPLLTMPLTGRPS